MRQKNPVMSIVTSSSVNHSGDFSGGFRKPICALRTLRYLKTDEYEHWDALVDASPQGSVLCRSWFLNAVSPEIDILGYFNDGHVVAGIPLYFESRFGFRICRMPKLVHTWGVVIEPLTGKASTIASREMEILAAFADELTRQTVFVQAFHPSLTNWLPFMWKGFRQTTHFSYVFEDLRNTEQLWSQMADKVRNNIRRAEKKGLTVIPCKSELVSSMTAESFNKQNMPLPFSPDYLGRIYSACTANGSGACFAAVDETGQPHASMFVVWDQKRMYGVASGTDPKLRSSGAESLLIWHVLKFAAERSQSFDLTGSVVGHIETFFRKFGGRLVPYNRIFKTPLLTYPFYPYASQLDNS
jgi:hypothetical protein